MKVNLQDIEESMRITSKTLDYEFRTVLNKKFNTPDDPIKIADWIYSVIGKKPTYVIRNFKTGKGMEYVSQNPGESFPVQEFEDIQKSLDKYLETLV